MKEDKEQRVITITGQVDIFEDMPGSDADAISILSQDGDEYIVNTRKMVKKLMPFAGEEVDILFQGTISKDHSGLEIFTVHSFKVLSEDALELISAAKEAPAPRAKHKRRDYDDDDEELDDDIEGLDQIVDADWDDAQDDGDEDGDDLDDLDDLGSLDEFVELDATEPAAPPKTDKNHKGDSSHPPITPKHKADKKR